MMLGKGLFMTQLFITGSPPADMPIDEGIMLMACVGGAIPCARAS